MPYTVFALKWRPQKFEEIIGQRHIVTTLKSSLEKERLANAYLFAGPRGVGKTSTARILAKALNCKEKPSFEPCGKCSSCLEITGGRSLDVIEIDGASNTGVDDIRALRESVKFAPASGKFKVYIIDEVHMLSTAAFNALLKTLEEPPEFVKFIFATTRADKIPSTVLSRCQRMDFRRISVMEIIAQLDKIVTTEKISIEKEVLFAIAKASDGALRDAESILDQLVSFSKDKVSLADVVSVLGLVEQEALFGITDKIINKDPEAALGLLSNLIDDGKDISVFLKSLIEHFRNLMVAKVTKGDSRLIDLPQEICQRLLEQSQSLGLEEIFSAFNILVNAQEMSKRLDSMYIPLEISLVRLANTKKEKSDSGSQMKTPEKPMEIQKPNRAAIAEKPSIPTPRNLEITRESIKPVQLIPLESIREAWQRIISNIEKVKMSVATYLNEGEPVKVQGDTLCVSFPKNYSLHKESLESKENKAIVEKALREAFDADFRVNFVLSKEIKEEIDIQSNPFVKSAMDMLGARVIKEE